MCVHTLNNRLPFTTVDLYVIYSTAGEQECFMTPNKFEWSFTSVNPRDFKLLEPLVKFDTHDFSLEKLNNNVLLN